MFMMEQRYAQGWGRHTQEHAHPWFTESSLIIRTVNGGGGEKAGRKQANIPFLEVPNAVMNLKGMEVSKLAEET